MGRAHHEIAEEEAQIHGDVLEALVEHVPLVDLAAVCRVSKEWNRAIFSSLRNFNKIKPWLIVHTQNSRSPRVISTHAYDPRSRVWIEIGSSMNHVSSVLQSSCSSLLYTVTPSKICYSNDPFHVSWRDVDGPQAWRKNPIVAVIGDKIIVAGGTCEFEDNALAVEMYHAKTNNWSACQALPVIFKQSASATWLSVTVTKNKIYMTEKCSGVSHAYDTETGNWEGPYDFRSDPRMLFTTVGYTNNRLIIVGLIGEDDVKKVKIYEMIEESPEKKKFIGEMPEALVEKVIGDKDIPMSSIGMSCAGDTVFLYNESAPEEIVMCEIDGDICWWESVRNIAANDTTRMGKFVFTSWKVEICDIQGALRMGKFKFTVKS